MKSLKCVSYTRLDHTNIRRVLNTGEHKHRHKTLLSQQRQMCLTHQGWLKKMFSFFFLLYKLGQLIAGALLVIKITNNKMVATKFVLLNLK